jgi:hypothetical protein
VSMEAKVQVQAAPATSPLLSSHYADPYCVFHVSPLLLCKIAWGVPLIVGFRSR